MTKKIIAQLKSLQNKEVNPNPEWLTKNRALLLSQIKNTVGDTPTTVKAENIWTGLSIFLPKSMVYNVVRPVAVLLVVAMVATSGWIATVDAAYNTLPGDWLYSAKRVVEKTQMVATNIVGSKDDATKLHVEFAKRRAVETKAIASSNVSGKDAKIKQSVNDLKEELKNVNNNLTEIQNTGANQTSAAVAKDINKNTETIKNVLQDAKDSLLAASTSSTDKTVSAAVSEAKDMVKDTNVKAVEVMVTKHLDGDNSVSKEEIKQAIGTSLQSAVTDIAESKQNAEGVKVIMDAVKVEVKSMSAASTTVAAATSTKELNDKITVVSGQVQEAAKQTNLVLVEGTKNATDAKDLLAANNLVQALDKVKEATEASKVAEKITDNTMQSVQTVLPTVSVNNVVKQEVVPAVVAPVSTNTVNKVEVIVIPATVSNPTVLPIQVVVTTTKR